MWWDGAGVEGAQAIDSVGPGGWPPVFGLSLATLDPADLEPGRRDAADLTRTSATPSSS